jgi:N-acetylneuraminic acid mutarotase/thiol-disulfide isomerase/thioredoxin
MTLQLRITASVFILMCGLMSVSQAQVAIPNQDAEIPSAVTSSPVTPVIDAAAGSQWSTGAPMPEAKKYHAVASLDGFVYTFGGNTISGTSLVLDKSSYKYNVELDMWTPIADFPLSSYNRAVAHAVNGKIYILAGAEYNSGTRDWQAISSVFEYDPVADKYTFKADMPMQQFFCGSGVIDDKIYLIAGRNNTAVTSATAYLTNVNVYDPATDSWSTATDYPQGVCYIGTASAGSSIVGTGGYSRFVPTYYSAATFVGALESDVLKWTRVDDYPISSLIYPCGVGIGDIAYFTGGRISANGNEAATSLTYAYDVTSSTWAPVEKKITGIQSSMLGTDGKFVVAPGGEIATAAPTTANELFDPNAEALSAIEVDKNPLLATVSKAASMPSDVPLQLTNLGAGELTWDIAVNGDFPWMTISGTSNGAIEGYGKTTVQVAIDPSKLADGKNEGSLLITSSSTQEPTIVVDVIAYLSDGVVTTEKKVLVEEFSGTWCGYCPYGVDILHALENSYGDRVAIITYHNGDPMVNTRSNQVISDLKVTSYPSASIDRIQYPGETKIPISRSLWDGKVREILDNTQSGVSIEIKNKYFQEDTRRISFDAEVTFLQAMQGDYRLLLVQTTNNRIYDQVKYNPTTILRGYVHDHVASGVFPDSRGYTLGDGSMIEPQTKFTEKFSFTSVDSLPELSDLTLFVYTRNDGPGPVLQVHVETMLQNLVSTQPVELAGSFALEQNFPNPFNPSTMIRYNVPNRSSVTLTVTDVLGRTVATLVNGVVNEGLHSVNFDANGLQSGNYFITLRSGDFVQTRSMTLLK